MKALLPAASLLLLSFTAMAQIGTRHITATSTATTSVKPDQAIVDVGVVTQAATAQDSASQNATLANAVLTRLTQVVGLLGDMKTISYSINPNYSSSSGNPPVLTGYTTSNTIEVTLSDLSLVGRVIDAATQAGANNVQSLRFTVQDTEPVRAQALALAAKQALAHAGAIASGLGATTGAVLSAVEGSSIIPVLSTLAPSAGSGTPTPVVTGLVTVSATVTVDVEIK